MRSLCTGLVVLALCLSVDGLRAGPNPNTKGFKNMRLGKHTHMSPPKSRYLSTKYANGTNIAVGGSVWPTSIFYTYVQVGTPLKSYAVAIDSGSSDLALSGAACQGCVRTPPNTQYDPKKSSTSSPLGHNFSNTYQTCDPSQPLQSCTISGPLYTDVGSLAGYGPVPVTVGVIDYQTSNFYQFQTIDGIMGMVGPGNGGNLFTNLCVRGGKCSPQWGICMQAGDHSNGTMTIGGVDESLSDGPIQYVPSNNFSQWHEINVHTLTVGGATIKANTNGPAILDTGTNDILLPTSIYNAVQTQICGTKGVKHCADFFSGKCFSLTDAEVAMYPDITLNLDNSVKLHMTPKDYLLKNSPAGTPGQYCWGIGDGQYYFIIGDTVMQNYYLVFAEQHVGWGPVNKKTCGSK